MAHVLHFNNSTAEKDDGDELSIRVADISLIGPVETNVGGLGHPGFAITLRNGCRVNLTNDNFDRSVNMRADVKAALESYKE